MDDEVFGCGGTIALCARKGTHILVIYLTDGAKGYDRRGNHRRSAVEIQRLEAELVRVRKREAQEAAKLLGLSEPVFFDCPDGGLGVDQATVARLADVLGRVRPEAVFLPSLADPHDDHWMTNGLFMEAAIRSGLQPTVSCWGYEIWSPVLANTVVDVTAIIEEKRAAMQAYESQNALCDFPRAILGLNTYRALFSQHGRGFAEAFYVAELDVYRGLYDSIGFGRQNRPSLRNTPLE
jgi:LmbE family N-acetylglucosaminyl deacetylase